MPDISEGLSSGGNPAPGDPFAAALAEKFESAGGDLVDAGTSNDSAPEPAKAAERDPETGRFVPKEAQAVEEPETPAEQPEADTSTSEDPAVEAFLAKYGGDINAAVKAAAHQTDLVGRQGQELGQTREQLAELRGRLDALMAAQQATPIPQISAEAAEERAIELSTTVGYQQAATQLANESLAGDARTYDALLRNWVLEDPIAAQRFDLDFQLWKRDQAAPTAPAPQDPRLAQVLESAEVDSMAVAIGHVAQERGDNWAGIAPFMDAALEQVDPTVLALVSSTDPEEKLRGTRMIADKAQLLALSGVAQAPAEAAALAAVARKQAGAAVATGSLRPAEVPAGSPQSRAEAISRFKEQLVEADSTNIADGLTFGTGPR